ncbi:MAG: hypothetical protein LBM01_02980 [Christensenellaceae bacterium]|jgi:hypothetical protein|nr:hypothetical protein [Christensenellaceae bacterium]
MLIKVKIESGFNLLRLARECGTSPCAIIAANNCENEKELREKTEIYIPVNESALII